MILNILSTVIAANAVGKIQQDNYRILDNCDLVSDACTVSAERMGLDSLEGNQNAVRDLNGNIFIIQESFDSGFKVYDPIADEAIECTKSGECPYVFDSNYDNYYFGPMNYYYRVGDYFYHCIDNAYSINFDTCLSLQEQFNSQLSMFRETTSDESYNEYNHNAGIAKPPLKRQVSGSKWYIDNYIYVKEEKFPRNHEGSCGFVAASIVLNFWDKTVHDGIVASNFKNSSTGALISTLYHDSSRNLKDRLVDYNNGVADSTGRTVANAVNKYCKDYGIHGSASWGLGKYGLDESLEAGRPAIIFGWIPDEEPGKIWNICHAVTCYGVDQRWWGGYYIVNYGWEEDSNKKYNEVSLGFGFVGETMTFELDLDSYRQEYTIKPSDYNFTSNYCPTKTSQTVNCGEISFETKRLRCGYIENEYINLSPRRNGFDTAYLEMKFKNPINYINVNISFWSDDERYNAPNQAVAYIQHKDLRFTKDTDWKNSFNLLNKVIKLPTDRTKQITLPIFFPLKTREIRFYTHFDVISGLNDRNKGRISIGDITIGTYC